MVNVCSHIAAFFLYIITICGTEPIPVQNTPKEVLAALSLQKSIQFDKDERYTSSTSWTYCKNPEKPPISQLMAARIKNHRRSLSGNRNSITLIEKYFQVPKNTDDNKK